MSDIEYGFCSAADLLKNPPSKEDEINAEDDYRRGFVDGIIESVDLINKIYNHGYVRPREISNIIENWIYTDLRRWKYGADDDYEKPGFGTTTPEFKIIHWQTIKKIVMQRDQYMCCECNSEKDLEIDHIEPVKYGGLPIESNLQVLCKNCNRKKGTN